MKSPKRSAATSASTFWTKTRGSLLPWTTTANRWRLPLCVFDTSDVVRLLRAAVDKAGGQRAWAAKAGVHRVTVNRVLSRQRPPTKQILKALNLHIVFVDDRTMAGRALRPSSLDAPLEQSDAPADVQEKRLRAQAGRRRVALYLRTSAAEADSRAQRKVLTAVAARRRWQIVHVFEDAHARQDGNGRHAPALDGLMKAAARGEIDMVATWSVDQLGRSMTAVLEVMKTLRTHAVDLFLHRQSVDTSDASGGTLFDVLDVFGELERTLISERVQVGIARARRKGHRFGRRPIEDTNPSAVEAVRSLRAKGLSMRRIAKSVGLAENTVIRLVHEATSSPLVAVRRRTSERTATRTAAVNGYLQGGC